MRVYHDPHRPGWVIALQGVIQVTIDRLQLDANSAQARAQLQVMVETHLNQPQIDPETGEPIEPTPPLEPVTDLDDISILVTALESAQTVEALKPVLQGILKWMSGD